MYLLVQEQECYDSRMNDETSAIVPADSASLATSRELRPASQNPFHVYLARLRSPASKKTMAAALKHASGLIAGGIDPENVPWHTLRYPNVADLRSKLSDKGMKPRTINKILSAVRGVVNEARKLGMMTRDAALDACDVDGYTVDDLPAGRSVERDETDEMIEKCPDTPLGRRDGAIIGLLFGGGMRRAEAVSVDLAAVNRSLWEIRVVGKGAKERLVPIPKRAAALVQRWIDARGTESGPLLASFDPSGKIRRGKDKRIARMSTTGIYVAFREIAARAGIENVTPHDARRTRATKMLSDGQSITHVRDIMGHKDVRTTARYDRSSDDAKRAAANKVDL